MAYDSDTDSDSDSSLNEEDVQNFISLVKKDSQAKKHKRPKMKQTKDKLKDKLKDELALADMLTGLSLKSKSDANKLADMLNDMQIKNVRKSKK